VGADMCDYRVLRMETPTNHRIMWHSVLKSDKKCEFQDIFKKPFFHFRIFLALISVALIKIEFGTFMWHSLALIRFFYTQKIYKSGLVNANILIGTYWHSLEKCVTEFGTH
jgi:hypothetical protein